MVFPFTFRRRIRRCIFGAKTACSRDALNLLLVALTEEEETKSYGRKMPVTYVTSFQALLKSSLATCLTGNAKSLACDTANEHALTCNRETCSCNLSAVQWNQW